MKITNFQLAQARLWLMDHYSVVRTDSLTREEMTEIHSLILRLTEILERCI